MITFNEFYNKWNGKYVEVVDPTSYAQCFDLILQWCVELGLPKYVFPFQYAYQIYTSFGNEQMKYFDKIVNGVSNSPKEGDIVVWSNPYNQAGGHTAIATGKGNSAGSLSDWFGAFSQNDPIRSPSVLRTYKYNYVLGWLHPKNYVPSQTADELIKIIKDKINTEVSDTAFRNWTRNLLKV